MNFLIDYDTRSVECKSKSGSLLDKYVEDSDLGMAVCIVDSEDELSLQMSLEEMQDLYTNVTLDDRKFADEDEAATLCWKALTDCEEDFPEYTAALGKKLLKAGQARSSDSAKSSSKSAAAKGKPSTKPASGAPKAPQKRIKLEGDEALTVVDGKCKKGSILDTIVTAINADMCSTANEVADYITANHVVPKTGELADEKFAWHNIKYFIKQGKLEVDEL